VLELLTRREREVITLLAKYGYSNRELARALYLSEATIKAYMTSAMYKTGHDNRVKLAVTAALELNPTQMSLADLLVEKEEA
jgi:DNA-binding NarL/FixJ family response regulator